MGLGDKARTAAEVARVVMHAEPKGGQMGPVAESLDRLWGYLTHKAREINGGWLHELKGVSKPYEIEYMGNRKTKEEDRMIGITCPRALFDDVLSYMKGRGVHKGDTKSKNLVVVSVQEIVKKS